MATSRGRCRELAVLAATLACVLAAACGGDDESSAEDGLPEGSDTTSQADGAEAVSPPAEPNDSVPDEGLEAAEPGVEEDSTALEDEDPSEDDLPEPLPPILLPVGTRIDAAPDEDISTAEYRVDDPVIVTVVRDVHGPGGEFLLPQGVRLLGRVRTSMGSGGPGEPAVLEIDFETLSADRYERPIEGTVVNRPVIEDPVAARLRQAASRRVAAMTVVPGLIMAGTIIEVELRASVEVPGFVGIEGMPPWGDSLMPPGVPGDSSARRDTARTAPTG